MEELVRTAIDLVVEIALVSLMTFGAYVLAQVKTFFKAKTSDKQYEQLKKIASDIYEYVEREYGEKIRSTGEEKFEYALYEFKRQMEKHSLPYTEEDLRMQIEKIIRQEKQ